MISGFIEYIGRYVSLNEEDKDLLSQIIEIRNYDKKARLTEMGEVEQYLNFVVKGLLRKYFYRGKDEVVKLIAKEGNILVSSVSFYGGIPSMYVVEAIEGSTVASISRNNLEQLFLSGDKWERMGRLMMTDIFIEKEYWLLDMIRYSPRERLFRFIKEQPDLIERVPQKFLASYLDIKPETFSRLKGLARTKNLIFY
ncbi:MAG: Crp/Fnr family transcriptional regulator [Chitinophagaceae bacterium]